MIYYDKCRLRDPYYFVQYNYNSILMAVEIVKNAKQNHIKKEEVKVCTTNY